MCQCFVFVLTCKSVGIYVYMCVCMRHYVQVGVCGVLCVESIYVCWYVYICVRVSMCAIVYLF